MLHSRWCAEAAQALLPHYNKKNKTKQTTKKNNKKQKHVLGGYRNANGILNTA